jgi:hypothetical protein
MKANELRIGNLLKHKDSDSIFTVTGLSEFGIDCQDNIEVTWMEYDHFEPILLTEEWFLKFRFNIKDHKSFHKTPIYFRSDMDSDYCFTYADFREDYGFYIEYTDSIDSDIDKLYPISFGIKYVHQLQNIYFVLIGVELIETNKDENDRSI